MTIELVRHKHSVGESNFHFLFTPAYRKAIFQDERVRKLVTAYLYAVAEELKIKVVAVNFGPDHEHVFLANCKNYSVVELAQRIKGFISRQMRKHHKKLFQHLLWGDRFWTRGYFYRSIGATTSGAVEFYISNSQEKHWEVIDYEFYKYSGQKALNEFS